MLRMLCQSVDEFIEDLEAHSEVYEKVIRISITKSEVKELIDEVLFQASAVVLANEEEKSYYLLQAVIDCGYDRGDATDNEGSYRAERSKDRVTKYAEKRGWKVLPGLPDF